MQGEYGYMTMSGAPHMSGSLMGVRTAVTEDSLHDNRVRAATAAPYKKERKPVKEFARDWLNKNPEVYAEFKRHCFELIMSGVRRFSADMVAHHVRYMVKLKSGGKRDYKVNNNVVSMMAHQFVNDSPQNADVFEFRKSPHADADMPTT